MTLPTPSDRATGVKTNGIGNRTTAHLNLTIYFPTTKRKRAPREVIADHKIPYAGKPK